MRRWMLALGSSIFVLAGSCGDRGETTAGASVVGRTFLSARVTEHGVEKELVAGTRLRLQFSDDLELTASAGCNTMGGPARIEGDRLIVGELSTTEIGCDPARHEQDTWVSAFLGGGPRFVVDDRSLVLRWREATIELLDRTVVDPDRPLEDTVWELDGIVDGDAVSSVPTDTSATLRIGAGRLTIEVVGCATGGAHVDIRPDLIELAPVVVTDAACGRDAAGVRDAMTSTLEGLVAYSIDAATLTLTHRDGDGLVLRAVD